MLLYKHPFYHVKHMDLFILKCVFILYQTNDYTFFNIFLLKNLFKRQVFCLRKHVFLPIYSSK